MTSVFMFVWVLKFILSILAFTTKEIRSLRIPWDSILVCLSEFCPINSNCALFVNHIHTKIEMKMNQPIRINFTFCTENFKICTQKFQNLHCLSIFRINWGALSKWECRHFCMYMITYWNNWWRLAIQSRKVFKIITKVLDKSVSSILALCLFS